MQKQVSCGIIPVYIKDNKFYILLVKGRHNHWGWPKGHIEQGESCIITALREFEEETGIPKSFVDLNKNINFEDNYWFVLNSQRIFKIVKYYIGFLKDGFEKYIRPQEGEITEIKLVELEEVKKYLEFEGMKKIIDKVKEFLLQNYNNIGKM